jgi:LppX_LprAFG lipoprotein
MNSRAHSLLLALAGLTLACSLLGLAACGGSSEPQNVDPQTVLATASANMKTIVGFHFLYEVHTPEAALANVGGGIVKVEGDINAEGHMRATVQLMASGLLIDVGFVALGDIQYIKYPVLNTWQSLKPADSPIGELNLSAFSIRILDQIVDTTYQGTDKKDGVQCYHINGMVAGANVQAIAGSVEATKMFETDIWVGIDDGLLREVDLIGPMGSKEVDGTWRSIMLSNLNVPVEIAAPQ